jgi:hypothetical protein
MPAAARGEHVAASSSGGDERTLKTALERLLSRVE